MNAQGQFDRVADELADLGVTTAKVFGKPSMMSGGKAFGCLFGDAMACRLGAGTAQHAAALAEAGAELFDPSGSGRAMKDWVVVPLAAVDRWAGYAEAARAHLSG
jgi:hypothetical protein